MDYVDELEKAYMAKPYIPSQDNQYQLDDLKLDDLNAWRVEITRQEAEHTTKLQSELNVMKGSLNTNTKSDRITKVTEFKKRTGVNLFNDKELLDNAPRKWVEDVKSGKLDFDKFIEQMDTIVGAKKVTTNPVNTAPNLGAVTGGSIPNVEPTTNNTDTVLIY